jgi:protease I
MRTRGRLNGRTIAALAADGFEKVELIVPLRASRRPAPRSTSCPYDADGSAG